MLIVVGYCIPFLPSPFVSVQGKLRHVFFMEQAVLVCKLKGKQYNIK
jgi:hypothetical protein